MIIYSVISSVARKIKLVFCIFFSSHIGFYQNKTKVRLYTLKKKKHLYFILLIALMNIFFHFENICTVYYENIFCLVGRKNASHERLIEKK